MPQLSNTSSCLGLQQTSNVVMDGVEYNTATEPKHLLAQERAKAKFNSRDLTYYLDGGPETTEAYEQIMTALERDPVFNQDDFYDLSKDELRELSMRRVAAINDASSGQPERVQMARYALNSIIDSGSGTRITVHFILFYNTLRGSGTDEQFNYWNGKGAGHLKKFFGCFAMTEMGHGSNVAGMETEAIFDEETDEFIINTPNLAATKWWIGGAAHTATHCIAYARLKVKGKDYGVKQFVVPLRNIEDFTLKPGIAIGDIGKKMGRDGIDNGWIQFTNVRIPRMFMLMRYSKVDRQGNVSQLPMASQLSYAALIAGRVAMVRSSFQVAKRFVTIAIRYATIRRQFGTKPGEPETRLIDYPYHQRRLMPRLAFCYAMNAASVELSEFHYAATAKLQAADPSDKAALGTVLDELKALFQASAGLKTFCTWACQNIIDECRQACGGHGYSGYSGFGQGYNDWVVMCTWEGDNNVLTLSAGRAAIQRVLSIRKGETPSADMEYITRAAQLSNTKLDGKSLEDHAVIIEAWEVAASNALNSAADIYVKELKANGGNVDLAFETISQQRFEAARIHTRLYLVRAFFNRAATADLSFRGVLLDLAKLFGLWSIELDSGLFLQSGYLTPADTRRVTELVDTFCGKVRDQAIPLTDAFNLSDFFINSPLGTYDGDVYHKYFTKVVQRNPGKTAKAPYYETVQKPYFFRNEEEKVDVTQLE